MYFNSEPIIRQLEAECRSKGSLYLSKINYSNENDIMLTCPFHSGGMEKKPSCGIKKTSDIGHCFTCGWSGRIHEIVAQVLNINHGEAERWLVRNFTDYTVEHRVNTTVHTEELLPMERKIKPSSQVLGFTEDELRRYDVYHSYLSTRGISEEVARKYRVGYDKITNAITFPVYTRQGKPMFVARRNVLFKMFTIPSGVTKPLYLGERANVGEKLLWVCESAIDALTAEINGQKAVALMGLSSARQIEDLRALKCRAYVLALDNDEAGRKASENLYKQLKDIGVVYRANIPQGYKDINDCRDCFDKISLTFF